MAKSILVVDDEAAVTLSLEGFFQHKEYEVLKAFDGDQALRLIEQNRPSVVILDLQMPRVNGVAVLEKIRSDYPEIKTLVITGFSSEYEEQLQRLKVEKVWVKPVSLTDLTRAVESLLEGTERPTLPTAGMAAADDSGRLRLLFVEGSREAYEQTLRPYFESEDRVPRCQTALARNGEEALRQIAEFKPQLIVLDSNRMPVGVEGGRLAARLSSAPDAPLEVILVDIPSREYRLGETPRERLRNLEEAVQRAARKHRLIPGGRERKP